MTSLIFRPYDSANAASIAAIYGHYVKNSVVTFDLEAPDAAQIHEKLSRISKAGHPLLIAWLDEEIVGFAYASSYKERPAYRFTCENAIYLAPNHLAQGFGSALLKELIVQSKAFGFNQMVAIITSGTNSSLAMHQKFGFKILGEFPELGYKFDGWHGIIHMQKKL